jgi:hypothetical protein
MPTYWSNDHNRARKPPSEEGVSAQEWLSNQIASQGRLAELDMHSQECRENATVCAYKREIRRENACPYQGNRGEALQMEREHHVDLCVCAKQGT